MNEPSANRLPGRGLAVAALMCLPCLGIALLTSGALAAIGGFLGNPVLIFPAALLVGAGLVMILRRHRGVRRRRVLPATDPPGGRRQST